MKEFPGSAVKSYQDILSLPFPNSFSSKRPHPSLSSACRTSSIMNDSIPIYHWTLLWGPPRAKVPSIILCVKKWNLPAPQRGGSSHSGEGQNRRFHLIKTERRGYKKIPLVEFEDIYKADLEKKFRLNRVILRGVLILVRQIPTGT